MGVFKWFREIFLEWLFSKQDRELLFPPKEPASTKHYHRIDTFLEIQKKTKLSQPILPNWYLELEAGRSGFFSESRYREWLDSQN